MSAVIAYDECPNTSCTIARSEALGDPVLDESADCLRRVLHGLAERQASLDLALLRPTLSLRPGVDARPPSEGALLSATSKKDTAKDATGGLLRKIGDGGVLVIKDVTSILSMNRDTRASVLAALREVYDGRWERNVGTDGGRSLTWTGRIVLVGAVTTAYDSAHSVIAAMGDRFALALVRVDSTVGRLDSGAQALRNVGHEPAMKAELSDVVADVLAQLDPDREKLSEPAMATLLAAANLVTLSRTAVERDQRGDLLEAHAPEAPTRFAKMLGQLVRSSQALGLDDDHGLRIALRVAGDSVPPVRLLVLGDVLLHPSRAVRRTSSGGCNARDRASTARCKSCTCSGSSRSKRSATTRAGGTASRPASTATPFGC